METHIECAMYGDSYRVCNVRRLIYREQYMEAHIHVKLIGYSYRG